MCAVAASGAALLFSDSSARGQTYTWNSPAGGNWNVAGNWLGNAVPASNNANSILFAGSTGYTSTYNLSTNPFVLNALLFNNASTAGVTLASSTNGIRLGGTTPSLLQDGAGPVAVTAPLLVNTNGATFGGAGVGDLSVAALTFTAGNTLTLGGAGNVSIAALANTDAGTTAKTVTNNIAAAGKGLTIGSLNLGGGANTFTLGGSGTTTVAGVIGQSGALPGSLTKADAGTLLLRGANTFTGTLQVNNGLADVDRLADSGDGSNGTGAIRILNGGNAAATLRYTGSGATLTRAIDIFGTGTGAGTAVVESSGAGPLVFGGASLSASGAVKTLTLGGTNAGANAVAGVIANGAGTLGVTKAGAGTWTLSAANTYTGPTTVTGGTLVQGNAAAFGGSTAFRVSGGVLDVQAAGLSIPTGASLTAGKAAGTSADVLGSVALAGGTLNVGGAGTAGTYSHGGNLAVGDGSTLQFDLNNVATPGGGVNDLVAVAGDLSLAGTVNVSLAALSGPLTAGNYTLFTYTGSLSGGAANLAPPTGLPAGRSTYAYSTATPGAVQLTVTGSAGQLTWVGGANANAWDTTTVNFAGEADSRFYDGDVVTFADAGAANSPVNLVGTLRPATVNVGGAANYTFAGTGSLAGAATVNKSGTGTLTVQTANAYTGVTNVTGGTLVVANPSALGTAAGNTVVGAGAQLQFAGGGTVSEPFTISGTGVAGGGALQNGAGATTLAGTVTLAADASVVNVDPANPLTIDAAGATAVNAGGFALTLGGSGDVNVNGPVVVGTGSVVKAGTGTLTFTGGANTGTGATTVSGGTLVLAKAASVNAVPSGTLTVGIGAGPATVRLAAAEQIPNAVAVVVNAGATFDLNGSTETVGSLAGTGAVTLGAAGGNSLLVNGAATTTFAGVISGNGGFSRTGGGTTVLAGHNTYGGTTVIQNEGARLALGIDDALPVGTTLSFPGTSNGAGANNDVVVDLNGHNQSIAALTSATTTGEVYIQNNSGAGTSVLTITNGAGSFGTAVTGAGQSRIRDNDGVATGGKVALTIAGGTTVLGSPSSYTGPTVVSGGTLFAGRANALSAGSAVTVGAAGTLDLGGYAQTVPALAGTGSVLSSGGSAVLTVAGATVDTFAGVISGSAGLTRSGTGTTILAGANSYFGDTAVSAGIILLAAGGTTGTGAVSVRGTGALGGTGSIAGPLTVSESGVLRRGNLVGSLTAAAGVTFAGGTLSVDLNGATAPGVDYDQLLVTAGDVNLGTGVAALAGTTGFVPQAGDKFWVVDNIGTGSVTGYLNDSAGTPLTTDGSLLTVGAAQFAIYYTADHATGGLTGGNDVALVATGVPEPGAAAVVRWAAVGLLAWRRRRRHGR